MNILLLNTYDITGGAARAVYRIHQGLRQAGANSQLLVWDKKSRDPSVISIGSPYAQKLPGPRFLTDLLPLIRYPRRRWTTWSIGWRWNGLLRQVRQRKPDLIHLNWVGRGFLPVRALASFRVPLVWTLTDMWPFTGGCHFTENCNRYRQSCGSCPQLSSQRERDLSRWIWHQKRKSWNGIDLTLVAPGDWMKKCAKTSSLFRDYPVETIPFGLDTRIFKPTDRRAARHAWGFSENKKIILSGGIKYTTDPRKGFKFLQSALGILSARGWAKEAELELVIFGAAAPSRPPHMGLKTTYLGLIENDERLASLYAAANVFVAPSMEESFCQTVLEALSCGAPCVGFHVGGLPDMIAHKRNGYLAPAFNIHCLADGIEWALTQNPLSQNGREQWKAKLERAFSSTSVAHQYLRLYEAMLERDQGIV